MIDVRDFTEIRNFGFNTIIFSFIATVVFTSYRMYALYDQSKKIHRLGSADSISLEFFSFFTFELMSLVLYGVDQKSLAIIVSGLQGFLHIPVLIAAFKFRKFKRREIGVLLFCAITIVPLMFIFDSASKKIWVNVLLDIAIVIIMLTPYQIWKAKTGKEVSIKLCVITIIGSTFWIIYGWATKIYNFIPISAVSVCANFLALYLKNKYKEPKIQTVE